MGHWWTWKEFEGSIGDYLAIREESVPEAG